jgi:hypothetical protein
MLFIASLQSCSSVLFGVMDIKKPMSMTPEEILVQGEKYGIPISDSYEMDSSFFSVATTLDTIRYKRDQKNLTQPLQVLYFDKSGRLISYLVNCSVGGFPNMKWNRYGTYNQFPAAQSIELDTMNTLNDHLLHINPLNNAPFPDLRTYDYTILVYWSGFMGRQSKHLVRVVQDNVGLAVGEKVMVLYVNTDNFWSKVEIQ